jgi:hypothetical protein
MNAFQSNYALIFHCFLVKMTCYRAKYDGILKPKSEIKEIKWLNYNDLNIISEVDKKIFRFLKEKGELK